MKIHQLLVAALLFGTAQGLTFTTQTSAAHAKAGYTKVSTIPDLLNLELGDRIEVKGLASGKMVFSQLSGAGLELQQDMTLSSIGRTAIEKALGKKLSGSGNKVAFRFTIKKSGSGFAYELFDRGSKQMLLNGPLTVMAGPSSATSQQIEFRAPLVRMKVTFNKASANASKGAATFSLGPVPVPGSLTYHEIAR
jgi:hypothetical protein